MRTLKPDLDNSRVLDLLTLAALSGDGWVHHPYRQLRVMWHSRVATLRRRGWNIQCRRVEGADGPDYQYRLIASGPRHPLEGIYKALHWKLRLYGGQRTP
jgi:hypothetical protein